jgi:hypothetical protein
MIIGRPRITSWSPYTSSILRRSGCRRSTKLRQNAQRNMWMIVMGVYQLALLPGGSVVITKGTQQVVLPQLVRWRWHFEGARAGSTPKIFFDVRNDVSLLTLVFIFAARWISNFSSAIIVARTRDFCTVWQSACEKTRP